MKQERLYPLIFIGLSVFTWLYLILRAIGNPLVFDEATSYFLFIKNGTFWPGQAFWSANNHLLNSLLAYFSTKVFGGEEWALRLPNLVAYPFFALFGFRLMRQLKSAVLRWWALVLFFSLHGIWEYFAFARGYGLMLSFMLASLWYLRESYYQFQIKTYLWLIFSSLLALLSNASAFPLFGLLLASALFLMARADIKLPSKIVLSLLSIIPLAFSFWWTWQLKKHQELYYGGERDFVNDSLVSIKTMVLNPSIHVDIFLAGGALFLIALIISKAWQNTINRPVSTWLAACFILITAFYPIGHYLIELKFPYDRALIYWLAFGLIAKLAWLDQEYIAGRKSLLLFLGWTLIFPILYPTKLSLDHASFATWSKEQIPKHFYLNRTSSLKKEPSIGGSYLLAPQWNFLQQKHQAQLPAFQVTDSPLLEIRLSEKKDWPKWQTHYSIIDSSANGLYLLQRLNPSVKSKLSSLELPKLVHHQANQLIYQSSKHLKVDAISSQLMIQAEQPLNKLAIALQVLDKEGKQVYWQAFRARDYLSNKKDWQAWRLFVILKDLAREGEEIKLFIWNPENESFSLKASDWTLWELN